MDTTLPGEFEVLLDLHDAYVNARTIAIKTDESMASLTKMVQLFSRDERIPAVTPRFCRQVSLISSSGMTPQRIIDRCSALMTMMIRLRGKGEGTMPREAPFSQFSAALPEKVEDPILGFPIKGGMIIPNKRVFLDIGRMPVSHFLQ